MDAGNFRYSRRVAKDNMLFRIGWWSQLLELNKSFTQTLADASQGTHKDCKKTVNMPSIQESIHLFNARIICAIFLHNWMQCIDSFSLLLKSYVRKGIDAKNPAILG